jgi:hypothetical protein
MSYPSITEVKTENDNAIMFYSRRGYPFIKFVGSEGVADTVNNIFLRQRDNPSQIGPLDSPQSLDTQNIPHNFCHLIQTTDVPFLEVNHPPSLTARYLTGTIKFVVVYIWAGGLVLLTQATTNFVIAYFSSIVLLPVIFLLTNTLDKVDVLGAQSIVFLRVGLAYMKRCLFGRNVLRLGYENAYPLVSTYNVKNNKGFISFYNYTFANMCSENVIVTEEVIFHKHLDATSSRL